MTESFTTVAVAGAIVRVVLYTTTEFAVTNKRVIAKVGFLHRRSLEVNLDKIESVTVNQSLTGRLLGFGTLRVRGTGSTDEFLGGIARVMAFREQIQQLALHSVAGRTTIARGRRGSRST
jgi:uncharacterized membrane protein YdbT with pleckstrin-like domain